VSLAGHCARRGSVVTVYRSVEADTGDAGRKVASWTVIATGIACSIEGVSDQIMQKVFGTPPAVRDRALIPGLPDVKLMDALVVTAGKRLGAKWRVEDVRPFDHGARSAHLEVALVASVETIP
jgi:hypothetical protein